MKTILQLLRNERLSIKILSYILLNNRYSVYLRNLYIKKKQKYSKSYEFKIKNYSNTFLNNSLVSPYTYNIHVQTENVIYCFWTGDNPLTKNRKESLNVLNKKTGIPIVLITPDNLSNYILQDYPLHKSYDHLSLVHKSDYLKMLFYVTFWWRLL